MPYLDPDEEQRKWGEEQAEEYGRQENARNTKLDDFISNPHSFSKHFDWLMGGVSEHKSVEAARKFLLVLQRPGVKPDDKSAAAEAFLSMKGNFGWKGRDLPKYRGGFTSEQPSVVECLDKLYRHAEKIRLAVSVLTDAKQGRGDLYNALQVDRRRVSAYPDNNDRRYHKLQKLNVLDAADAFLQNPSEKTANELRKAINSSADYKAKTGRFLFFKSPKASETGQHVDAVLALADRVFPRPSPTPPEPAVHQQQTRRPF